MSSEQKQWIAFDSDLKEFTLTPSASVIPGLHYLQVTLSDNKDSRAYNFLIDVEKAIDPEPSDQEDPEDKIVEEEEYSDPELEQTEDDKEIVSDAEDTSN